MQFRNVPTQQGKCNPNFTKSQNNLKRKQNETTLHHKKHHQCVFTYSNYSLFAAHRIWESLYSIITTLFKTKKPQERAI